MVDDGHSGQFLYFSAFQEFHLFAVVYIIIIKCGGGTGKLLLFVVMEISYFEQLQQ